MAVKKKEAAAKIQDTPKGQNASQDNENKAVLGQFLSEIEKRAYELYLQRVNKGGNGSDLSDWLQAEAEIKSKYRLG
jgi:hypothetical protein